MSNVKNTKIILRRQTMAMESSKWIATVASIWIQCSCGASYAFGIYSSVLKSSQGYDQSTLNTVSVFKDIGANAGVLSGVLYTAVSASRRSSVSAGPWVVHVAGAIQCFVGYFFIWLSVSGVVHRPPVPIMCFFTLIAAHAQTFFSTANVVTAVRNFPDYGGTIVGIMKGFLGLSGAVLIQVYQALFKGNPSSFIIMLAMLPTLVSLLFMCLVRTYEIRSLHYRKHLNGLSVVSLVVAAYLMTLIISENVFTFPLLVHVLTFLVLLLLLASPLRIAIEAQREDSWKLSRNLSTERSPLIDAPKTIESKKFSAAEVLPTHYHEVPSDATPKKATSSDNMLQFGSEMTLFEAMGTANFWLLFVAMVCGMGSGMATINNISQIGESLGYKTVEIHTLVSLWSIWNFLGRFGAGYLSDIFLHKKGWGRPLLMAITLATMTAGHIVIASGFFGNLYVGSVLVGVCYGSQWSLMPTITSEIFGVLHMGTIFNTIGIASPVGSFLLSVRVIGFIYDKEAASQGNTCYGTHCFTLSFFILAAVSFLGFLVALILFFRTRRFYMLVVLEGVRNSARQCEGNM